MGQTPPPAVGTSSWGGPDPPQQLAPGRGGSSDIAHEIAHSAERAGGVAFRLPERRLNVAAVTAVTTICNGPYSKATVSGCSCPRFLTTRYLQISGWYIWLVTRVLGGARPARGGRVDLRLSCC